MKIRPIRPSLVAMMAAMTIDAAHAQQSRQSLESTNNALITANGRGLITGPIVNGMFNGVITSSGMLNDTNNWTGLNTFNGPSVGSIMGVPFTTTDNRATSGDSVNGRFGQQLNLKSDFGAKFDALTQSDGLITAGSAVFTSAAAAFTSADCHSGVGCTGPSDKTIDVDFAGPGCGPLHTTITSVTDAHAVGLATPATCTIGYQYAYQWSLGTAQSGSGSYAPGNTVTLQGGTSTVAATAVVKATQAISATIVSAGASGLTAANSNTGTCFVQGTTGAGTLAIFSLTITAGAATAVNIVSDGGVYTTNPTTLTNEPVVPVTNCSGLTGAVLSVKMGPAVLSSANHAAMGQYSVLPAFPAATTSNGAGTGLTVTPVTYRAGNFIYGTDDTVAWTAAFNASIAKNLAGQYNCLIMPGGASIVTATLPIWNNTGPCIHGQSRDKSILFLAASYVGTAVLVDNAWIVLAQNTPNDGALTPSTSVKYGTDLADFTIMGTKFSPNVQHGIIFADNNDFITTNRLMIRGLNGTCLGMGSIRTDVKSFTRESNFNNTQLQYCGSPTADAFYINSQNVGLSDDLYFANLNIYASNGISAHIEADGGASTGHVYFDRLRIEGSEFDPDATAADLLVIGDTTETGKVSSIWIDKVQLIDPYLGQYAIRMTGVGANASFTNHISGTIGGGASWGGGLLVDNARSNEFHFSAMSTRDVNVHFTANAGLSNDVTGEACLERSWTYQIDASAVPSSRTCFYNAVGGGSGQPIISGGANDGTVIGGNKPGAGTVNLSLIRVAPWQIPAGVNSFSAGSANSSSTGSFSADAASRSALLSGTYTQAFGSFQPIDHGWLTSRILSGFSAGGGFGGNQLQETLLGCKTAASNAATCVLTSDGTGTPSGVNIANPQSNTAYATSLVCAAHDSTNNTNSIAWVGVSALLQKQASLASVAGAFGSIPTPLTIGTTTGASLTPAANTTSGGASLTFAAPTTNSAVWVITCYLPSVQTD